MSEPPEAPLQLTHPLLTAWREPGVLQVGSDGRWFVLDGVPEQLPRVIDLLSDTRTRPELHTLVPDLAPGWVDWLCQHLSSVGLLTTAGEGVGRPILVCGTGPLAAATLSALRLAGLQPRHVPARTELIPTEGLVVVAPASAEPDRTLLNRLARDGVEHLIVRAEPSRVVVGPLVTPSVGPCVRCDDLARAQQDRRWPVLLAQLCTTTVEPDTTLARWASATVAAAVRARLSGATCELVGRTLELGLTDFRLRSRTWPVQPECGCHDDRFSGSGTLAG